MGANVVEGHRLRLHQALAILGPHSARTAALIEVNLGWQQADRLEPGGIAHPERYVSVLLTRARVRLAEGRLDLAQACLDEARRRAGVADLGTDVAGLFAAVEKSLEEAQRSP